MIHAFLDSVVARIEDCLQEGKNLTDNVVIGVGEEGNNLASG